MKRYEYEPQEQPATEADQRLFLVTVFIALLCLFGLCAMIVG